MKLRYYLRGLGIGMFVTALLMGIALHDRQPLSDAEIRVRAMELGMVDGDSRTLAGSQTPQDPEQNAPVSTATPSPESAPTQSPEPAAASTETPIPAETSTPEDGVDLPTETSTPEDGVDSPAEASTPEAGTDSLKPLPMVTRKPPAETPEPTVVPSTPISGQSQESSSETPENVTFVVQRGQSSYGVAKALAEAGLIADASAFDRYLEDNGYSKRISVGTYEIPVDSSEEEIAKIITRSR